MLMQFEQFMYVTSFYVCRYIRHLAKVIPRVIELEGEPTGY